MNIIKHIGLAILCGILFIIIDYAMDWVFGAESPATPMSSLVKGMLLYAGILGFKWLEKKHMERN